MFIDLIVMHKALRQEGGPGDTVVSRTDLQSMPLGPSVKKDVKLLISERNV